MQSLADSLDARGPAGLAGVEIPGPWPQTAPGNPATHHAKTLMGIGRLEPLGTSSTVPEADDHAVPRGPLRS